MPLESVGRDVSSLWSTTGSIMGVAIAKTLGLQVQSSLVMYSTGAGMTILKAWWLESFFFPFCWVMLHSVVAQSPSVSKNGVRV